MTPLLRTLRSVHSALRTLACRLAGYEVVVVWGPLPSPVLRSRRERRVELKAHWALTRAEAREWVDCYAHVPGAHARVWAAPLAACYNPTRPSASPFSR